MASGAYIDRELNNDEFEVPCRKCPVKESGDIDDDDTNVLPPSQQQLQAVEAEAAIVEVDGSSPPVGPSTPARDNGELLLLPLQVEASSSSSSASGFRQTSSSCVDTVYDCSPQTPKCSIFDPFAPATLSNNHTHLHHSPADDQSAFSDTELFEAVFVNLLEAIIVCKQAEGGDTTLLPLFNTKAGSQNCKTPPLGTRPINQAPLTCAGAPIKPSGKSRNIDKGICRKLEF